MLLKMGSSTSLSLFFSFVGTSRKVTNRRPYADVSPVISRFFMLPRRPSFVSMGSSPFVLYCLAERVFLYLRSSCRPSIVSAISSRLFFCVFVMQTELCFSGRQSFLTSLITQVEFFLSQRTAAVFFQCRHAEGVFVSATTSRFFLFVVVLLIGPNGLLVVVFAATSMGGVRRTCSNVRP